ncbi:hypothetical protein CLOM_g7044 [Closterium sp. NIES-68]|nr:hypothetical protein CLOM_g7044 [Closterium sp. NIES-68]GJP62380.1 hypothetical protein CLOP_g19454 [Closterium sp. NIES-67]
MRHPFRLQCHFARRARNPRFASSGAEQEVRAPPRRSPHAATCAETLPACVDTLAAACGETFRGKELHLRKACSFGGPFEELRRKPAESACARSRVSGASQNSRIRNTE